MAENSLKYKKEKMKSFWYKIWNDVRAWWYDVRKWAYVLFHSKILKLNIHENGLFFVYRGYTVYWIAPNRKKDRFKFICPDTGWHFNYLHLILLKIDFAIINVALDKNENL
jgi:hypothetical protein